MVREAKRAQARAREAAAATAALPQTGNNPELSSLSRVKVRTKMFITVIPRYCGIKKMIAKMLVGYLIVGLILLDLPYRTKSS